LGHWVGKVTNIQLGLSMVSVLAFFCLTARIVKRTRSRCEKLVSSPIYLFIISPIQDRYYLTFNRLGRFNREGLGAGLKFGNTLHDGLDSIRTLADSHLFGENLSHDETYDPHH
jgi:hypothetical protein